MIAININKNTACIKCNERLTSGMVGAQCAFSFDTEWDYLSKTAVFVAGSVQRDVILTGNECVIPWEVLEHSGYQLYIGVYGANGNGDLVIPTVYVKVGNILPGADPCGDESTDPTLPVWAQIQSEIGDLGELETEEKTNLVNAINEAAQSGGGGGGTSDHRQLTNRDADNQHPISAVAGLQSALDGKQPVGDYATSGELDALSDIVAGKADAADVPTKTSELTNDSGFLTEHQSLDSFATEAYVNNHHDNTKQDAITDLSTIRSGAALGATALQSVPSEYVTETELNAHHDTTKQDTLTAGENISIVNNVISAAGGGGGDSWELIKKLEITEAITSWTINLDENGNPFALNDFIVYVEHPKTENATEGYALTKMNNGTGIPYTSPVLTPSPNYKRVARWEHQKIGSNCCDMWGKRDNLAEISEFNYKFDTSGEGGKPVTSVGLAYGSCNMVAANGSKIYLYGRRTNS